MDCWMVALVGVMFGGTVGYFASVLTVVMDYDQDDAPLPKPPARNIDVVERKITELGETIAGHRHALAVHNRRCFVACKERRERDDSEGANCRFHLYRNEQCPDCPHRWMIHLPGLNMPPAGQ